MKFNLIDTVVLSRDIPKYNLKKGDLGTVVQIYGEHDYEVEFVTAGGHTQALTSLNEKDIRIVESKDMVSVRVLQEVV
ncbi:unnamed protein product [marine sediment metagenome]|uniref:DUF4926 domain-containing protein n=1 Tax=marine sediment metagenome TaxID=412755 RepID=X0X0R4_9ZZZZ